MCYRCFKPAPDCVCADVTPVDNRTGVIVVQHPRERNHPFGTERFARLGLNRVQIRICDPGAAGAATALADLPPNTALLYPSPESREVSSLAASERPDHIVLVDGTWHQAKKLVREVDSLRSLPRVCLTPDAPSEYRIRRQPRADCLSTIEATVALLRVLEPDTHGLDGILVAFRRMVDRQIERSKQAPARRVRAPRFRPPRAPVPAVFAAGYSNLVVAYGEVLTVEGDRGPSNEVVHWCAARPATGETFERLVKPSRGTLNPAHVVPTGLSLDHITAGVTRERFSDEWEAFLKPHDVVACWNTRVLKAAKVPAGLLLKGAACNLLGRGCGHIEEFVQTTGSPPIPTDFQGRAAEHMGCLLAVAEHMRGLAIAM